MTFMIRGARSSTVSRHKTVHNPSAINHVKHNLTDIKWYWCCMDSNIKLCVVDYGWVNTMGQYNQYYTNRNKEFMGGAMSLM